ncbi:fatty-acid--CoA ligase FadD5 [Dietzia psychralcaliphila]|uniref:fatty-acid--CoA ligase FadD5 n=1 Tax=Dietzia psychralcaliphila TaxID=139021 RepID=UPI001C1E4E1B|nr:fatty-acid--CoA ligase FadD5 [Dietzia psychralcaliphila]
MTTATMDPVADLHAARRNHWNTWVATHAEMNPDGEALRYLGQTTTWSQLHERSGLFADALARRGVTSGDRVMLITLNNPEFVEAVLGINELGAIAVPVNFRLTPAELAYLVSDCAPKVVITDALLAPLVGAIRAQGEEPGDHIVIGGESGTAAQTTYADALAEEGEAHPPVDVPEDSTALIMYTSGTTGRPKGAMLSYENLTAQSLTCIRVFRLFDEEGRALCAAPMFHIAALGSIAPSLQLGGVTVVHPLQAFDPSALLDTLEAEQITSVFLVPVQWQAVCAEQKARPRTLVLRNISWGAAPSTDTILRAMAETFPDALNCAVFGQTEMSPITCALDGDDAIRKLGSVGKVIPTLQARVVDAFGEPVGPGEVGEIVYRGPTTMSGYWNKPAETAEAFEGGWFHSGDLVRMDDEGFVYVVDRKKDMIISGGENIYCAEVENVIAGHPRIREVAVIGRKDDTWGEVPVAVVAQHEEEGGSDITLDELTGWLRDKLAGFKLPKHLVHVEELPRNASGKVVKGALRSEHGSSGV